MSDNNIAKIDKNFAVPSTVDKADILFHNVESAPFQIYGIAYEGDRYRRLPMAVASTVSDRVLALSDHTAGGRVRFSTNSSYVAIRAVMPKVSRMGHFALSASAGFDLYADGKYIKTFVPSVKMECGYESIISFNSAEMRNITINFPLYSAVASLEIGLQEEAVLAPHPDYSIKKPVVFYGSSITQGACACRAGNTYQNILSRKLNFDYLNLGFAGACRAEPAVIDYICTLDMPLLVFDYDHNAKSAEYLQETHLPALRKLRAAHPDIPFVVMSRPDQDSGEADTIRRAKLIEENCRILREESDAPVHFVNGIDIFHSHDKDMMTIDGTHPTDLGFYCMAQALYKVLEQYFP